MIVEIEILSIPREINPTLYQGNDFINMYKTLFENNYSCYLKDILPLSIPGTPANASTFSRFYLGVTESYKTELNIKGFEVHECNVSLTIWRNYLDSLTVNSNHFDRDIIFRTNK